MKPNFIESKRSLSPNYTMGSQSTIKTNVTMNYYNKINKNIPSTMTIENPNEAMSKSFTPNDLANTVNKNGHFHKNGMISERYHPVSPQDFNYDPNQVLFKTIPND
jgi:hypothetical protein